MAASIEWWLIEVDGAGDITEIMTYDNENGGKREALAALDRCETTPGVIVTVEGRKYYGNDDDGVTNIKYQRTGEVRGTPITDEQKMYQVRDDKWYDAGEEPDFTS